MDTFRCQNPGCCKDSDYSMTEVRSHDSTVQCQHCHTIHRLEVTPPRAGEPQKLRAGGLYWTPG